MFYTSIRLTPAMDVSADLEELGRTPVAVISSGAKAILDIRRTIEYLETKGVTVSTLGEKGVDVPAFYSRESGVKSPFNSPSVEEAAKLIRIIPAVGRVNKIRCQSIPGITIWHRYIQSYSQGIRNTKRRD